MKQRLGWGIEFLALGLAIAGVGCQQSVDGERDRLVTTSEGPGASADVTISAEGLAIRARDDQGKAERLTIDTTATLRRVISC